MNKSKKELEQKCVYYNGRGKCAFWNQQKCIYDKGMVPFPYVCCVEEREEAEFMRKNFE